MCCMSYLVYADTSSCCVAIATQQPDIRIISATVVQDNGSFQRNMFLFHLVPYRKEEPVQLCNLRISYQIFDCCGTEGTSQCRPHASTELQSDKECFVTFECVLFSSIWTEILTLW